MPAQISLCVITGNESQHIVRLLDSFAAAFDELSLVRAIGATKPDDTWAKAEEWCSSHGKDFIGTEYKNALENSGWLHVDDFAAARNTAFGASSGEWLFWADCDDLIDDAAALRALAASGRADMYRLPYSVPDVGKQTMRERLIRASLFRDGRIWRWAIHENLLVAPDDKWENAVAPIFTHRPSGPKAGGDRRNLRILTAALKDAPTHYFYCHQENFYMRRHEESRRFGDLFLSLPLRPKVLEYQCLLNMSELAELKSESAAYALRAYQLFPQQKEAVATLVKASLQEENAPAVDVWSKTLVELPKLKPEDRIWCYEPRWDGWAAWDLRARALRYVGDVGGADKAQLRVHNGKAIEFSLLHATRGRLDKAIGARELWLGLADDPESVQHIFAFDSGDEDASRWLRSFEHVVSTGNTCVAAWNAAAFRATGRVLVQLSDDWLPPRGWDTKLRDAYAGRHPLREQFVIAVSDGHRKDDLLCMAILSRARWEAQDKDVFSPEYESVFSDNEFSFRAFRDGIVIDARDKIEFIHNHPAFGKAAMDDTYKRQNAPEKYRRGLETFKRRNREPEARAFAQ